MTLESMGSQEEPKEVLPMEGVNGVQEKRKRIRPPRRARLVAGLRGSPCDGRTARRTVPKFRNESRFQPDRRRAHGSGTLNGYFNPLTTYRSETARR